MARPANSGYWMLTALTTQLVLMMYVLVYAAAIRLRYIEPGTARPYKIPGGKVGVWVVAGAGLAGCILGFIIGFVPPTGVKHWSTPIYVGAMVIGIVISSVPPFIVEKVKKPSWKLAHPDSSLVDVDDASSDRVSAAASHGQSLARGGCGYEDA